MVAGHLTEKKGYYYAVLNYKDYTGKRKSKWVSTGLPVRGEYYCDTAYGYAMQCRW